MVLTAQLQHLQTAFKSDEKWTYCMGVQGMQLNRCQPNPVIFHFSGKSRICTAGRVNAMYTSL